jgi:signal transduction histidine kinase
VTAPDKRQRWYVRIRWVAVFFSAAAALSAEGFLSIEVPPEAYLTLAFVALYNIVFSFLAAGVFLHVALDLLSLVFLIHYTGGVENPFLSYFVFHTVLTSTVYGRKAGWVQAGAVMAAVAALLFLESASIIPHRHLMGFLAVEIYDNPRYVITVYFAFSTTIALATYFAAAASEKLRDALKALEEKDRLKSEYVKIVAHDIKNPLATALSIISVMLGGYSGRFDEKTGELLGRIKRQLEYLHSYVTDLLTLSAIRTEKTLVLEPVEVLPLIERSIGMTAEKRTGKNIDISVSVEAGAIVMADKQALLCAVTNLISNSLEYTPDGGRVWVGTRSEERYLAITVKDTGAGIPDADIPRIFDEFYRGGNVVKTTKGTGLGLTLVKNIVERHGGTIEVESALGKGTTVTVKLPQAQGARD